MEWVLSFLCVFLAFCGVNGLTVTGVQILPWTSEKKVTQLQEDVRKHIWASDMDGRWLATSSSTVWQVLFLILLGVHIHKPSSPGNFVGETVSSLTTRP